MKQEIAVDRLDVDSNQQIEQFQSSDKEVYRKPEIKFGSWYSDIDSTNYFLEYIECLGLLPGTNVIVLPDSYHYYYDSEDLLKVETVISLKPLNSVKSLNKFLESIACNLPSNGSFVGCFIDHYNNSVKPVRTRSGINQNLADEDLIKNGIISSNRIFNRIMSLMNSSIFRSLTSNDVKRFLKSNGFVIKNISEKNGISYFYARKDQKLD